MKHKIITTEQGKVVIDETAKISVNDFITDGYLVWKWLDDSSLLGRKKVIATINFSLDKDIPMVTVEDEVERLANINGYHDQPSDDLYKEGFFDGYYASQQKGVYSEDDLIAFGKSCFYKGYDKSENDDANCFTAWREEALGLISDLKQEYIELEMEDYLTEELALKGNFQNFRIKTNRVDGQLISYTKK